MEPWNPYDLKRVPLKTLLGELTRRSLTATGFPDKVRIACKLPLQFAIARISVLDLDTDEHELVEFKEGVDPKL
jgi:hypothetical protein